jgi:hypothetical protein
MSLTTADMGESLSEFAYFCLFFTTFFENSSSSLDVFSTTYENEWFQIPA